MLEPGGRVVLISGAARGIGRAVLERLLGRGFTVSAGVRDPAVMPPRERLSVSRYDAEDAAAPGAWVADAVARHGRIDALVIAAGINPPSPVLAEDESAADAMWRVNVKGPQRLARAAWPHLVAAGHGRIVIVSSLSGKRVPNENAGYAMSKYAAVALSHALRREGWDHGIRSTVVCPSFVATDMTARLTATPREQMTQPGDLAVLIEQCLLLPDNLVLAELLVNWRLEPGF